ncbi:MAG: bifunctional phosphoglucose/phosphomannose isomerase [Candidatus Omnitrophota bacterium]|jgi:glucose/mannose-6-phosphate isomerase
MKRSLTLENIRKLDKANMLGLLLDFPLQLRQAKEIADVVKILFAKRDFQKIVFTGLGGSAIGADLVRSYLYFESRLPMIVLREYDLPACIDSGTLVFVSSYSGNTEETLSAYRQAKEKGATIIAVSSGGVLEESALKDKVTFISIPKDSPPRCALGYMSIIPLCVLANLGLVKDASSSISQAAAFLEDLRKSLKPQTGVKDNPAKYIAAKLFNKFPVIYSSSIHFDVAATRLKGQLAENAKALGSSHVFPEMNHNEIVGWQNPKKLFKNFIVLLLRDKAVNPRVNKRMEITKDILRKEGVEVLEVWSRGEGLLSRMFSLIYIGDFISYYLAILYGIDPTPVERVTYLKNQLAQSR